MGGLLQIDPSAYAAASRTIGCSVTAVVRNAAAVLTDDLPACAGMAGTDPAGSNWAESYDTCASVVLRATRDTGNASLRLAELLEATGYNYALAESDSTYGGGPPPPDITDYGSQSVRFDIDLPPAAGSEPPTPPAGWHLIAHVVARVWPNGHQGRLRAAADAWDTAASVLIDASTAVANTVYVIAQQCGPETDAAIDACNSLRDQLDALACINHALADACSEYAHHLDHVHSTIEHELAELAAWSVGIQTVGAALSAVTFGAAEAPTQAEQVSRIAATAARIAAIIDRLGAALAAAGDSLGSLIARASEITTALNPLLTARRAIATTEAIKVGEITPVQAAVAELDDAAKISQVPLRLPLRQIERKYKHASVFGVRSARGSNGFKLYMTAIQDFIYDESTIRILGRYRGCAAILNYNTESRLVVIQRLDGTFWSGWRMNTNEFHHILTDGRIGGG